MTIADQARNLAISLEAKKDKLVQLQSNDWKVTFTVQTIDMDARLTKAPMGTRYAMVLVEIGDDELPVKREEAMPDQRPVQGQPSARPQSNQPQAGAKRDWRDIPPPQQAGIRCDDAIFTAFLKEGYPEEWRESRDTAACVRLICAVESRGQLIDGPSRVIWHQLDTEFQAWKALEHA